MRKVVLPRRAINWDGSYFLDILGPILKGLGTLEPVQPILAIFRDDTLSKPELEAKLKTLLKSRSVELVVKDD